MQPGLVAKRIIKAVHAKLNQVDPERSNVDLSIVRECPFHSILTGAMKEEQLMSRLVFISVRPWKESSGLMSKIDIY